jgi:rhomboid protease GluP
VTIGISLSALLLPTTSDLAFSVLALDKEAVRDGEWWRLLTVTLVHGNLLHLGFNMYALYIVGPIVEAMYGRPLYVFFYLLAAVGGSLASYLVVPGVSVGASGAIFGLFGVLAVSSWAHRPALGARGRAMTSQIVMLIVINVAIGFTFPGIDNAAHLGGLAAGAWLGLVVVPRGAATLSDFWSRVPTPGAAVPRRGISPLLQAAAVLALFVVLLLLMSLPPLWLG